MHGGDSSSFQWEEVHTLLSIWGRSGLTKARDQLSLPHRETAQGNTASPFLPLPSGWSMVCPGHQVVKHRVAHGPCDHEKPDQAAIVRLLTQAVCVSSLCRNACTRQCWMPFFKFVFHGDKHLVLEWFSRFLTQFQGKTNVHGARCLAMQKPYKKRHCRVNLCVICFH